MTITPNTWLISDTHFGHSNIVKYCNRPMNHNELMLHAWKSLVSEDDQVLHLGDIMVWYGPTVDHWKEEISLLPGDKFFLRGNHDKFKTGEYDFLGWTRIGEFVQEIKGQRVLFSHYPDEDRIGEWDINVHGHIHNNPLDIKLASTRRRYFNISVEKTDYKPIRAGELLTF